jgi:membrane protease YdiL (CAAX protease family)
LAMTLIASIPFVLVIGAQFGGGVIGGHLPSWAETSLTGFSILVEIGFAVAALRLIVGRDWRRVVALRMPSLTHLVLVLVAFLPMVLLGNVAYELIKLIVPDVFASIGVRDPMEYAVDMARSWPVSVAVLLIGVGPALAEELWCRAFLGRGLVGNYGVVGGVCLTSFLFGAIHFIPRQGMAALLLGLWLHFTYLATRSLLVPMLLHFLNNSLAVVITQLPSIEALDEPTGVPLLLILSGVLVMVVIGWTLYHCRARLMPPPEPDHWAPSYPGVEIPPAWSYTAITHPRPNWLEIALIVLTFGGFVAQIVILARNGG